MGYDISFSRQQYQEALLAGECEPPGVFAPFINVDPQNYKRLKNNSSSPNIASLKERFGPKWFDRLSGAVGLTLRHSKKYFPAYSLLMNEVLNNEWLAAVDSSEFHRDHVIHQPMSVYVGMSLLKGRDLSKEEDNDDSANRIKFNGKILLEHCVYMMAESPKCKYLRDYLVQLGANPEIFFGDTMDPGKLKLKLDAQDYVEFRKWLFLDTFFLATLFHDFGYPWSFINKVHEKLKTHSPIENTIAQNSRRIAQQYSERLVLYPLKGYRDGDITAPAPWSDDFYKLVEDSLSKTHGLPGAIALLHLNDVIRKYPIDDYDRPISRFCIEWAAMAVMMHDMIKMYAKINDDGKLERNNPHLRLSLSRDPLSFMLTLTDLIQDFDRPDASFKMSAHRYSKTDEGKVFNQADFESVVNFDSRCRGVKLNWDPTNGLLKIIYYYKREGDFLKNRDDDIPKNQLLYFDPIIGYLDYSDAGIKKVELSAELKKG